MKITYLTKTAILISFVLGSFDHLTAQIHAIEPTLKEKALQSIENGDIEQGYAQISTWIQSHPFDHEAYRYRAQLYETTKQFREAEADYNSLIELAPTNREGLLGRGRVLYRLKKYQSAKLDFEACLTAPPGETTQIIYRQSATGGGTSEIFTAQTDNPAFIFYHLGLCSIALGQFDEAIVLLDSAIHHNPALADFWAEKGKAKAALGDKEKALQDYEVALELNPDYFLVRQRIAFLRNDDEMTQLEELNLAVMDYPDDPETYLQRGYFLFNLRYYQESIHDFDQVLAIDPEDSQALIYRGKAYSSLNNLDAAENDFSEVIRLDESDVEAYIARGQIRYRAVNLEAALADFRMALQYDPEDPSGYYHRGITLHRMGKIAQACPDFLRAKELGMKEAEGVWQKVCSTSD